MRRWFFSFLFLCLNVINGFSQTVVNGQADLRDFNFEGKDPAYLYGRWAFVYRNFVDPVSDSIQWTEMYVPGSWHRSGFDVLGFASYRVKVKLPRDRKDLSLYIPIVNSAARIFIDGRLVTEIGTVGNNKDEHYPKFDGTICSLDDAPDEIQIDIHVSNFTYFSSGLPRSPYIDRTASIIENLSRVNGIENFFAGSLIALFIYQLILYLLYQRGKPYLWLSLICLTVALRAMIVHGGSFLLPKLFPEVHWEIWKKIEFGGVYLVTALFPLYVYHLFKEYAPRWPMYFFLTITAALCALTLVTPQHIYGQVLDVCHLGLLLGFVYAVFSIGRAWRAGNSDARVILVGVLASFPFILLEIVKNSAYTFFYINLNYLVELGVLVFLIFQVYLLANHYAKSYAKLERVNIDLEQRINERTGQLQTANTVKDRLLSVMSHDIKSPLNSLRGILQIYNQGALSQEEFGTFTRYIENDLNRTSMLLENILYWTASQMKGITVKKERFDLHKLVTENFQLFQTAADQKKITLQHNVVNPSIINTDRNILNLVLRNLIANALKFSFEGGTIDVSTERAGEQFIIVVSDTGMGMDQEMLDHLFEPETVASTYGTKNEKGTGLGLSICREYLAEVEGELKVESTKGVGSKFSIVLPMPA